MEQTGNLIQTLTSSGINIQIANELDSLCQNGILNATDISEEIKEALKELPNEAALAAFVELKKAAPKTKKDLTLLELIKTQKQKINRPGPDPDKLAAILERTKFNLEVTTGQRKYGGPPPNWEGPAPGLGHEIFCGRIPKDIYEDELIPLFESCGELWNLRLMIEPTTGLSRGFCFVTFVSKDGAQNSVKKLNNYQIRSRKLLKVNISVANVRLFVGNIPKSKTREDILEEFKKQTDGLVDVIIYNSPDDTKKKNRGFAFLEYENHKMASIAKHKIGHGYTRVWGCDIIVDWADPLEEPDEDTMSKVKVLYVRNLKSDVTDDQLREAFESFGKVDRVKKVKDYAFVHFDDRENAIKALNELNGKKLGDSDIQIFLAKPPTENKQKEKRKLQSKTMFGRNAFDDSCLPPFGYPNPGGPRRGRGIAASYPTRGAIRQAPSYNYDYYGGGAPAHRSFGRTGMSYTTDDYYNYSAPEDYYHYSTVYYDNSSGAPRGGRGRGASAHQPSARGHAPLWTPSMAYTTGPQTQNWGGTGRGYSHEAGGSVHQWNTAPRQ